jgi:hypothetical protein
MENHLAVNPDARESDDPVAGDRALAAIAHSFVVETPPEAKLIEIAKQIELVFR